MDDATFKQGKFTPATHLPIVSMKYMMNNAPRAIIIMAASYSDEVASKLKSKMKKSVEITILRDYGLEKIN